MRRVVAAKLPLDALRTDQGFQGLLGILEWAYGGDTADNILQAVVGLLECKRGDSDMLTWINWLDMLVSRLANFGIVLDERFSETLALLNSNPNADQRAMVVASTSQSLVFSQVLVAIRQLFQSPSTSRPIYCMFGLEAQRRLNNKTPTGNKVSAQSGSRVTCWKCGKRGHVQRDCPEKRTSALTLMAQEASTDEEGSSRAMPTAENKSGGAGIRVGWSLHNTRSVFLPCFAVFGTLLVLRKVWLGLDFRLDSGKILEGNGFCYASITRNKWPSARGRLSRGATSPAPRCNAGQP